jgi:hypothetical protein
MPKNPTFPTLYNTLITLSISFLTKNGYLKPNQWKSGIMTWSRNGNKIGSISIEVCLYRGESPYLELSYKSNDTPIKYRVQLVSTPSNLGKGVVWFFICPHTIKRCRKLHLCNSYFYHRSAFTNCMYEKQTESHKNRKLGQLFDKWNNSDKALQLFNSKHFKMQYNGKPTKRYLKLIKQAEAGKGISEMELLLS